jgi:hypothetical protein
MNKEFIPHQEALDLKHLGFDEAISTYYSFPDIELSYVMDGHSKVSVRRNSQFGHAVSAPTYSQAFRWFREKYQLHSYIEGAYPWFRFYINSEDNRWEGHKHLSHEEAELECLKKLIQIVKENKQ